MLTSLRLLGRTTVTRRCISSSIAHHVEQRKFQKVMVANRGEIAIRVFRALTEMEIRSVAIYSEQDKNSMHRQKADEAYRVGDGLAPVAAYLDVPSIIDQAVKHNVDAIHPGYGFLSERHDFAQACKDAGIVFIGPTPSVMARMGDKVAARKSAIEAGVKVLPGTEAPISTAAEAMAFCQEFGCPVMLKAAAGGGGRGMRRVERMEEVEEAFVRASSEAKSAFGDGRMFIERYIPNARHIEVQILGDNHNNVVHLYERDCSVQRRHQKVVEIAPAPQLPDETRKAMLADAVKLCKHVGYQNAGTVEFLLGEDGKYYFIEVNARLQVEHTVTEEVTGVDIVKKQIRIAEGLSLPTLGLTQDHIKLHGSSIQCRVTTEDPAKDFQPDSGRIDVFRTGEGMGIRLDSASAYPGAVISPHYDSLLCKVISHGSSHEAACSKMSRALKESRIRGVKTNIPFILNVLENRDFVKGAVNTSFLTDNPQLFNFAPSQNRGQKLLQYLADVSLNGPKTPLATGLPPSRQQPDVPAVQPGSPPIGFREVLKKQGPAGLAKAVRQHKGLLLTDTTFRDAHQSLLATRVRSHDILKIAPFVSHNMPGLFSSENWGGATFDVCLKFLYECPWERLEAMRKLMPNMLSQCLLRGANAMGYQNYPDNVIDEFCKLSVQAGMDVFRVFDSLNYAPNLVVGMEAVGKAGGVVEACIAYTGDVADPTRTRYNLEYYLKLADQLVKAGTHILCIKDMAGVLRPEAARILVGELRSRYPNLPIHIHTHDTAGMGVISMVEAAKAGADIVDCAVDSMSGMTSQPSMGAIVAAVKGTPLDTGVDPAAISRYNTYWEQTRPLYAPFECTSTMKSGNADVFQHEIPGGQYTNLQFQAYSLGLGSQFDIVKERYRIANQALGDITKVTPSSKTVGDLAQMMVQNDIGSLEELLEKAETLTFPKSVVDYFKGDLGQPPYGFPKELQHKVLRGAKSMTDRPGKYAQPLDFSKVKADLMTKHNVNDISDYDVMSSVMFPREFDEMMAVRRDFGPVHRLPTDVFLAGLKGTQPTEVEIEEGKTLSIRLLSIGELNGKGEREMFFELNGQMRAIYVRDNEVSKNIVTRERAAAGNKLSVGCPMPGEILDVKVKVGDSVKAREPLFVLSAMKMEMVVEAPVSGKVKRILCASKEKLEAGDLVIELE